MLRRVIASVPLLLSMFLPPSAHANAETGELVVCDDAGWCEVLPAPAGCSRVPVRPVALVSNSTGYQAWFFGDERCSLASRLFAVMPHEQCVTTGVDVKGYLTG